MCGRVENTNEVEAGAVLTVVLTCNGCGEATVLALTVGLA